MSTRLKCLPLVRLRKLATGFFNEHGLVDKMLEVCIVIADDLDLQALVESSLDPLLTCIV